MEGTRRASTALKAAAIVMLAIIAMALCACKPADMDQTTYDLGHQAVSVGESYLKGDVGYSDARERLDSIYDELDSYTPQHEDSHFFITCDVLEMKRYVGIPGGESATSTTDDEFSDALDKLKDDLD